MKKSNVMSVLVLVCICLVSALLLSTLNLITTPWLEDKNYRKTQDSLREVYPGGSDFKEINLKEYDLPESITAAYSEASGGFVIQSTVEGYAPGLVIMCGIDKDGRIVGADYIASNETNSAEVGLGDRFVGKVEAEMTPDIVAGPTSTLTTNAYYGAVLDALSAFTVLKGGRTPEQVFSDNFNLALGTSKKSHERWFATELLVGVDALYKTDSADDGVVMLIGDRFVGVKAGVATSSIGAYDESGVITDPTAEEKATAEAAYALYSATTPTDVEIPAGTKTNVLKVSVTATGNYVINMVTTGSYSAEGEWAHGDGANIEFTVSITPAGRIIDVITTKSSESKGYGDVCVKESFYASIRGAVREDILDLNFSSISPDDYDDQIPADATGPAVIAGATFTTVYYQQALLDAFDVVTALLGSN